jgi:type I restriction enzyme M protein
MANSKGSIADFISGIDVKATLEEVEAVQPFARRLVEDFGYPKKNIITHPQYRVKRSPSDTKKSYPIDIAVFRTDKKDDDDLYIIVECKQKKRRDGIGQLKDYLDLSSASIGVWFNGHEHSYIQKYVDSKGVNAYREIPLIPLFGQRIEDIGQFYRRDLVSTLNLRTVFRDIRNYIAGNATGITRDDTIAGEIINILFCKIYDEINTAQDEILTFRHGINEDIKDVANRLRSLFDLVKGDYSEVFDSTDTIRLDDKTLSYVIGELQIYCVTESERDILGEAFEVFIGPALKGAQGQFFTPRNAGRRGRI